jgi:hypothetical protein
MSSSPPSLQQIAKTFRLAGWSSLWVQGILGVVSAGILLFAGSVVTPTPRTSEPGTGIGAAFTTLSIVILFIATYWSFRYVVTGKQLVASATVRPKKSETIQLLRLGLTISLAGMLIALVGAQAIVGALAAKAFSQGIGNPIALGDQSRFVQPLDILVVQASINVILGQFAGIAAALWLLNRMNR